jgi:hypothetical protein
MFGTLPTGNIQNPAPATLVQGFPKVAALVSAEGLRSGVMIHPDFFSMDMLVRLN